MSAARARSILKRAGYAEGGAADELPAAPDKYTEMEAAANEESKKPGPNLKDRMGQAFVRAGKAHDYAKVSPREDRAKGGRT